MLSARYPAYTPGKVSFHYTKPCYKNSASLKKNPFYNFAFANLLISRMDKRTVQLTKEEMQLPDFHFKEVEELYENDLTIPDELYDSLLHKDRALLIEDLEKVLQHSITKQEIFTAKNISFKNTYSVWHTLFLLKDLEATESLPAVINLLKQNEDIIYFYLGDSIEDFGWELFYSLAAYNLRPLIDFYKELNDNYSYRIDIIETLKQLYLHEPEKRLQIESYLRELLFYSTTVNRHNDVYIDDITNTLIQTIGQLDLRSLFSELKTLIKEDKLPIIYGIDWDGFEKQFVSGKYDSTKDLQILRSRQQIYTEYLKAREDDDDDGFNFYDDLEDPDEYLAALDRNDAEEDLLEERENNLEEKRKAYEALHTPYVKKEPDVGRNDPCPCGSGKKYKKCHGKS